MAHKSVAIPPARCCKPCAAFTTRAPHAQRRHKHSAPRGRIQLSVQALPGDGEGGSPPSKPGMLSSGGGDDESPYSRASFLRFFLTFFFTTLLLAFLYRLVMFLRHGRGGGSNDGGGDKEKKKKKGGKDGDKKEDESKGGDDDKKEETTGDKIKKSLPFASLSLASLSKATSAPHASATPIDSAASVPVADEPQAPVTAPAAAPLRLGGPDEGTADDIETIRRLLRDVFEQQMVLDSRLRVVEPSAQSRGDESALVDSVATGAIAPRARYVSVAHTAGRARVSHTLEGCAGAISHSGRVDYSRAGLHAGPRLHSCVHVDRTDGARSVATLRTLASGSGLRLWQAQLRRALGSRCEAVLAPAGARFCDIATPLHACPGVTT